MEQTPQQVAHEISSIRELKLSRFSTQSLLLRSEDPFFGKDKKGQEKRAKITEEFESLDQLKRDKCLATFEKYLFDPGLNRSTQIEPDNFKRIKKIASSVRQEEPETTEKVEIYNRAALIEIATQSIVLGNNIAFINLDVKNLRGADLIGFGEQLLRQLAKSMLSEGVRLNSSDLTVIPARYGGDEFKFIVIYKGKTKGFLSQSNLVGVLNSTRQAFQKRQAYYTQTTFEEKVENGQTQIVSKQDDYAATPEFKQEEIIIPEKPVEKKRILLEFLATGKLPEEEDLNIGRGKSLSQGEERAFVAGKTKEINSFIADRVEDTVGQIESFLKGHPELTEERKVVDDLISHGKVNLAAALAFRLKSYIEHPFLGSEVLQFPDFSRHLVMRESGKVVYAFCPWLKIFNQMYGMSNTDEFIKTLHNYLKDEAFANFSGVKGVKGADFAFFNSNWKIPEEYYKHPVQYIDPKGHIDLDSTPFPLLLKKLKKSGVPIFFAIHDFKQSETLDQHGVEVLLTNLDHQAQMQFIRWLNNVWQTDASSAEEMLNFYLGVRREDRLMNIKYWLQRVVKQDQLSKEFSNMILALK